MVVWIGNYGVLLNFNDETKSTSVYDRKHGDDEGIYDENQRKGQENMHAVREEHNKSGDNMCKHVSNEWNDQHTDGRARKYYEIGELLGGEAMRFKTAT